MVTGRKRLLDTDSSECRRVGAYHENERAPSLCRRTFQPGRREQRLAARRRRNALTPMTPGLNDGESVNAPNNDNEVLI